MSALSELFSGIAGAIRSKTGETGTMKPMEFPEKIAGIRTGGSGDRTPVFNTGTFTPGGANRATTIEHGLGVVPDVALIFPISASPTTATGFLSTVNYSLAFANATGAKAQSYINNGSPMTALDMAEYHIERNEANMKAMSLPRGATDKLFYVDGDSTTYLATNLKYCWMAFGNLV